MTRPAPDCIRLGRAVDAVYLATQIVHGDAGRIRRWMATQILHTLDNIYDIAELERPTP